MKSRSWWTVRKTTQGARPDVTSRAAASRPVSTGIEMSNTTASGLSIVAISYAAWPSATAPTMSKSGESMSIR